MVMDSLGIDVDASDSDNMRTFKKVTVSTEEFTYDEVVVWFRMLSKISKCQGLAACAEDYAQRLVVEDERNEGRHWLMADKEDWSFMKKLHYQMLMEFGLDRDVQLPFIGTPVARIPASPLQVTPQWSGIYGNSLPTPPVATDAGGITAALAGFKWKHPSDLPLS